MCRSSSPTAASTTSFDDCGTYLRRTGRSPSRSAPRCPAWSAPCGHAVRAAAVPELDRRCAEIFGIQCAGLAKRIEQLPPRAAAQYRHLGGLDSTLALLVAVKDVRPARQPSVADRPA